MDCHLCRFNARVKCGFYRDFPWEITPCSKCSPHKNPTNTTQFHEDMWTEVPPALPEQVLPISVLGDFVAGLMHLKPAMRDAVCLRYERKSYLEIGQALNITAPGAQSRVRRAIECWPALREFLPADHVDTRDKDGCRVYSDDTGSDDEP